MKTATKISKNIEATVVCPYCKAENFFNNHENPELLKNGGVVECDMFACGEKFNIPPINLQGEK